MDWIILFALLSLLFLTAMAVSDERHPFKAKQTCSVGDCRFSIPSWWRPVKKRETFVRFITNSDWQGEFSWKSRRGLSTEEYLREIVKKKMQAIVFDSPDIVTGHRRVQIEGMATVKEERRIYCHLSLSAFPSGILFCQFTSGPLNGMMEGPSFDSVLQNLRFTPSLKKRMAA